MIGQKGLKLSGGQRQRLAIARSIYSSPKILILDEPTSSQDSKSNQKIIDNLLNVKPTFINGGWIEIDSLDDLKNLEKIDENFNI